jgi:hypothetical protein
MYMKHGHGHAARTLTRGVDVVLNRTYSMDMNVQHGHERAPWTWTCTMDKDIPNDMGMLYGNVHAAWTWTRAYIKFVRLLRVHQHCNY